MPQQVLDNPTNTEQPIDWKNSVEVDSNNGAVVADAPIDWKNSVEPAPKEEGLVGELFAGLDNAASNVLRWFNKSSVIGQLRDTVAQKNITEQITKDKGREATTDEVSAALADREKTIKSGSLLGEDMAGMPMAFGMIPFGLAHPITAIGGTAGSALINHFVSIKRWQEQHEPEAPLYAQHAAELGDFLIAAIPFGIAGKIEGGVKGFYRKASEELKLPPTTNIPADRVKDIFGDTSGVLTPEEQADLAKELNLKSEDLKEGINKGMNIPTEKVIDLAKKPYWGKVKDILNPTTEAMKAAKEVIPQENLTDKKAEFDPETGEVMVYKQKNPTSDPIKMGEIVSGYIKKSTETLPLTKNLERDFTNLKTASVADEIRAKRILEQVDITPAEAERMYHYDENKSEKLTPREQEIYTKVIEPLKKGSRALFEKIREKSIPINEDVYTARYVADRGGVFEKLKQGYKNISGGILKKSAGTFKHRVMKVLVDEEGNRAVVSIKDGKVTQWINKEPMELGNLNLKSYEDIMDKELTPVRNKLNNLQKELNLLNRSAKSRDISKIRRQTITDDMLELQDKEKEITEKYNPGELNRKVFIDKNKSRWTIGEATSKEIEANSSIKYHKNVLLNRLTSYNTLRKIDRATEFLDSFKESPEFPKISLEYGTANIPEGWKSVSLPQFRGYAFEPRVADALNNFSSKLYKGDNPFQALSNVNSFLRTAIFFNPMIHIPNIANHWVVNRGAMKWLMPKEYATLWKTGGRAMEAVFKQNDDYLAMLDSGSNLLFHKYSGSTLQDLMLAKMGEEAKTNSKLAEMISKDLGYINPVNWVKAIYNFSGKATWASNDIATMQAIYEEMDAGKSMTEAIDSTSKHIPNYVIPSRIMNSAAISKLMSDPNITMFGAYHYGALKSYGEMSKSLLGNVPLEERAEALDKIAMAATVMFFIYPMLDKIAQGITGDKNAHVRRAGSSTFPDNIIKMVKGQVGAQQLVQSVATPAVGAKEGIELAFNRDLFTGKEIVHYGNEMEDLKDFTVSSVAPLSAMQRIEEGKISWKDYLLSMAGVSKADPNRGKIFRMQDAKADMQKDVDKLYLKNPEEALKKIEAFNVRQVKALVGIAKEEGLTDIPDKKALNKFLITGVKDKNVPTLKVEDYFKKQKINKRKKINSPEQDKKITDMLKTLGMKDNE